MHHRVSALETSCVFKENASQLANQTLRAPIFSSATTTYVCKSLSASVTMTVLLTKSAFKTPLDRRNVLTCASQSSAAETPNVHQSTIKQSARAKQVTEAIPKTTRSAVRKWNAKPTINVQTTNCVTDLLVKSPVWLTILVGTMPFVLPNIISRCAIVNPVSRVSPNRAVT